MVAAAQIADDLDLAEEAFLHRPVLRGRVLCLELVERGQRLDGQRHVHEPAGERRRGLERRREPDGERRTRLDRAVVAERLTGGEHPLERGQRAVAEAAAVLIGDGRIADVLVGGAELARRSLEEDTRSAARLRLDELAHRADVVRGDERVLPRERGRVAGVVDDGAEHVPVRVRRDPPDDDRVVRARSGIEAAHEAAVLAGRIGEVTVAGEVTAARRPGQRRGNETVDRLAARLEDRVAQLVEVRADELAARVVAPTHRRPGGRMGVGAVDEQLAGLQRERLAHGREHALGVGDTAQVSEQGDVERDEESRTTAGGLQRQRRRRERAVDAGREIVAGRSPHAGVDAVGRGGVAPSEADQPREGGRRDLKRDRGAHERRRRPAGIVCTADAAYDRRRRGVKAGHALAV